MVLRSAGKRTWISLQVCCPRLCLPAPWRVTKYNTVSGSDNGGSGDGDDDYAGDDESPESAGWLTKESWLNSLHG